MIDTEIKVTPQIAAEHGLTPEEYARTQKILGRDPSFTELGIFSVMWSEHCSYKSSRVHLKRLPTRGRWILGMGWWRFSRLNRTTIRVLWSRFRARLREWAGFCGIFLQWGRGRLRCWIRCGLGRSLQGLKPLK